MKKRVKFKSGEKLQPQGPGTVTKSYDVIGDIAVLRIPTGLKRRSRSIAESLMQTHKHVKTVLQQAGAVSGEFRLRRLQWLKGEKRTETVHKEFGCVFKVDLEKCYFSPRLSFERMRVARLVQPDEIVVNMFSGVGSFSILMAKCTHVQKVYSIDVNPDAVESMRQNIRLNRLGGRIVPILGDAKEFVAERLQHVADRVVMPLPEKAFEYLDYAVLALKPAGGWIHYYDFVHALKGEDPVEKARAKIAGGLQKSGVDFDVSFGRVVRATGPNWYQVVLDVHVSKRVD